MKGDPKLVLTASGESVGGKVTFSTYTGADTQLWKLDLIDKWKEPEFDPNIERQFTQNKTTGRNGTTAQAWVCHIAEGTLEGTTAWEKKSDSQVSSHFVIGKSGRIVQMVDVVDTAWCNGTRNDPNSSAYWGNAMPSIVAENAKNGFYNANEYTISIEFEGFYNQTKGRITNAQLEAAAWLMAYYKQEKGCTIPLDREHINGHYQIAPVSRPNCPGQQFPFGELIARVHELAGGEVNPPTGNTGLDPDKLYFIKKKGTEEYLTVLENFYEDGTLGPNEIGANMGLCKLLPFDYSQKKPNPRQLYRIRDNSVICPATDSLGESGKLLANYGNDITIGNQFNEAVFLMRFENNSYFIVSNVKDKQQILSASELMFVEKTVAVATDLWEVKAFDKNEKNKDRKYIYNREELIYPDVYYHLYRLKEYNVTGYSGVKGVCVSNYNLQSKESIELFHPFSGMKGTDIDSSENRVCIDPIRKIYWSIPSVIKEFYRIVFNKPEYNPLIGDYLYNLFGAYMPGSQEYHVGVDINSIYFADGKKQGIPVHSAHNGRVVLLGGDFGTVGIYDEENDVTYLYFHLIEFDKELKLGGQIEFQQPLGRESNKGLKVKKPDDSIHLHFEVRKGNVAKKGKENGGTNNTTGNAPLIETQWGVHPIMDNLMPYSYMLIHKNY